MATVVIVFALGVAAGFVAGTVVVGHVRRMCDGMTVEVNEDTL